MHKYLPPLLIVLAAVGGYWILMGSAEEESWDAGWTEEVTPSGAPPAPREAELTAEGVAPPAADKKTRKPPASVDPRTRPVGTLIVTPVGPDLKPVDGKLLRMYVEPLRSGGFPTKLGRYDQETRAWTFLKVPAGQVKVRLFSDHIVRQEQVVSVRAEQDNPVTVEVTPAGCIAYDVMLYDKTRPPSVRLQLYDWMDRPTKAWYQVRTPRSMTSPREAMTITQGPEGLVMGLLPGRYRLKVQSENDEWDDAEVNVEAGRTHKVSLEVRR